MKPPHPAGNHDLKALTDKDYMPFGKHKDIKMANVPAEYLLYLFDLPFVEESWPRVFKYIDENFDVLLKEQTEQRQNKNKS